MFYSIRRFLHEWQAATAEAIDSPNSSEDQNIASLGVTHKRKTEATYVVVSQLALTFFVIGLCAWAVTREATSEVSVRLAHTGFGIVMGFWFR
jgi:glucose-6-phosphate dehydrogenase assembly protein OpcA